MLNNVCCYRRQTWGGKESQQVKMAPPRVQNSVTLFGSAPWGFRLSGGKEFNQPLVITRITPGSVAARSGLTSGDVLVAVNGLFVTEMTQDQCEVKIKQAVGSIQLVVEKNAAAVSQNSSGEITMDADRSIYVQGGPTHNRTGQSGTATRPMKVPISGHNSVPVFDPSMLKKSASTKQGTVVMKGPGKSKVIHAQYNTPMGMYSNDNIIDTVQAQAQSMGVSLPGASGDSSPLNPNSAVFREVHRQSAAPNKSNQSRSFKMLQSFVENEN
uniref:PDZ and LIM domain protein 3 isoform X1 n=1 Tax=Ciona intestinalis TaxID=7719 RepID=UPI000EF4BD88|nr:PDZ and LIM domain protein 3 isoform X1 [Ciona intestinalis]|eukprot:XP_026693534.1 PDZ and LIM domain protein 3 isoform X1 [Ciona intestinalis]